MYKGYCFNNLSRFSLLAIVCFGGTASYTQCSGNSVSWFLWVLKRMGVFKMLLGLHI